MSLGAFAEGVLNTREHSKEGFVHMGSKKPPELLRLHSLVASANQKGKYCNYRFSIQGCKTLLSSTLQQVQPSG